MFYRIGFRNVFRQKRRTTFTVLTMFGGFVLSSISVAWMDGSYSNIIDNFTRTRLGHIQIHQHEYPDRPSLYRTIDGVDSVGAVLDGMARVESWAPRIYAAGLASVNDRSAGARIIGIDPTREARTTAFNPQVHRGRPLARDPAHEALVGEGLAGRLGADLGDEVVLLSQAADGSMANDIYTIVGLVDSGDNATNQTSVYLHLADAQELFVLQNRVHEIVIVSQRPKRLFELADDITAAIQRPDLVVEPWQVFAKSFYDAMKADEAGNWVTLAILVLMVAVGVLNTVLMSVLERRREYGLLRAVGTRPQLVMGVVLWEVLVMAVMAVIVGFAAALGINYWMTIKGIPLPMALEFAGTTYSHIYAEINVRSYVIPAVTVVASALIVAIFPAIRAARTRPAVAMRTH
jgi:ABC-type lipoprotein release transport system permease subunit